MTECDPDAVEPVVTITFTWGDGDDDLLIVGPDCEDEGLWWNALELPAFAMRYTTAPPSAWVPGVLLLAAVPDAAALTGVIAARGADAAGLEAQKAVLEAALAHWAYTVTVKSDDTVVGYVWNAQPTIPQWGVVTPQRQDMAVAEGAVSIPVNPCVVTP